MKVIKTSELERVNVATTVQEKYIRFPTDASLYGLFSAAALNFAKLFKAIAALPAPLTSLRFFMTTLFLALTTLSGSNRFKKVLFQ